MSKMLFTFKWGKSIYVTDNQLEKILLQYYKKTEVDEILKQYVTKIDLAGELVEYAKLDDLNILDNHLTGMINDNTDLINGNTETLNEVVDALKNARLWNIVGMWNSETTYKIGDVVGYTNGELYLSIINDNLNNIPSNTPQNWIKLTGIQSINLDDYYDKIQINQILTKYAKLNDTNTFKAEQTFKADDNPTSFRINSFEWNGTKYSGLYANDSSGIRLKFEIGDRGVPEIKTQGKNDLVVKNLVEPTENSQAATKGYVDNAIGGISGGTTIKTIIIQNQSDVRVKSGEEKTIISFSRDELEPQVIESIDNGRFNVTLQTPNHSSFYKWNYVAGTYGIFILMSNTIDYNELVFYSGNIIASLNYW